MSILIDDATSTVRTKKIRKLFDRSCILPVLKIYGICNVKIFTSSIGTQSTL